MCERFYYLIFYCCCRLFQYLIQKRYYNGIMAKKSSSDNSNALPFDNGSPANNILNGLQGFPNTKKVMQVLQLIKVMKVLQLIKVMKVLQLIKIQKLNKVLPRTPWDLRGPKVTQVPKDRPAIMD